MKSIRFNRLCRALSLPALLLALSANAQSSSSDAGSTTEAMPRRASIIFIQCQGLGYGDLSCYGQTAFQTPNIDKLAAEGIRFTNYTSIGASSPSHAALMLGEDASQLQQRAGADVPLAALDTTVAQVLQRAGYHTGLIGDWDLGDKNSTGAPWKKGFDEFAGYLNARDAENFYVDYLFRYMPRKSSDAVSMQSNAFIGREAVYANSGDQRGQYIPDFLTKAALNFIKNNQPDIFNHYQPFFLLLNYNIPGDDRSQVPTDAPYSEENWPQAAKNKAAMIARLDNYVGELRGQLHKFGMTNNVAIFLASATVAETNAAVASDFFHSNVLPDDPRVPMIVYWPDHVPAAQVSGFQWSARNFLPTAAEIGLAETPADVSQTSVLPVLTGQSN